MQAYNKYLVLVSIALCLTIVILHNILAKKIFKTFMKNRIISAFKLAQPDFKKWQSAIRAILGGRAITGSNFEFDDINEPKMNVVQALQQFRFMKNNYKTSCGYLVAVLLELCCVKSCNNARYSKTITNDNYQRRQKPVFTSGSAEPSAGWAGRDHQFNINQNNHFIQGRSVFLLVWGTVTAHIQILIFYRILMR